MKLGEIYRKAIEAGIGSDPRGRDAVLKVLAQNGKAFAEVKQEEKDLFDGESLVNPYADSRILWGSGDEEVGTAFVGIDVEAAEILLADRLRQRGTPVDVVISHHPEGAAFANLYSVMQMQSDILSRLGVPVNVAEDLMEGRAKEVERRLMPVNHGRAIDAARLLDIPFLCIHTPADNAVATFLQQIFDERRPGTVSDILDTLKGIPEYRAAAKSGAGPKVMLGSPGRTAGKVFVDMTGGTEGAKDIFASLTAAGVSTIVAMHLSEEHRKEAEKNHLNVVIAGHIASDNLGMNLILDEVLGEARVTVLEGSGFHRISRLP